MALAPPASSESRAGVALVVDARQRRNRFGRYAAEILRAEGLAGLDVLELGALRPGDLRPYGVVVLTGCGAVPGLLPLLEDYVQAGGRLVLLRPALELAPLAGLEPLYQARHQPRLLVNSRSPVVGGFPYEPIQVAGPVDVCRPGPDASVLARTVAADWPVEAHPAIVERTVGPGRVLSFLYDLPHTVARLRQGDPELAECDSDGLVGVRPNDAMQWQIDVRAGYIPQAEVHQALLARAVEWLCPWPLPRLWYLPGQAQAALILTGDLCAHRPDEILVDEADLAERHGGTLTFYLYAGTQFDPQVAAQLRERGHTLSIHPYAVPFSAPHMDATLGAHLAGFAARYGARPRTVRHHCLQWLGWAEQAKLERRHGLEMDLNFTTARPLRNGYLFGAGRPLRFVDDAGQVVDTWQQPTHFEDDLILGEHEISLRIGTEEACALFDDLLDGAVRRWHTALAVNLHPGNYARYSRTWGQHLVAAAARHAVPIWNAERWLDFTRERAALALPPPASLGAGGAWRVDVPAGSASPDLALLIPEQFAGRTLREPEGPAQDLYGWRYRALPLHGRPAALDLLYE